MGSNQKPYQLAETWREFRRCRAGFLDPLRVSILDREVDGEQRWHTVGRFEGILLLLVVHLIWDDWIEGIPVEFVRIISARKVTPTEREIYGENR